MMKKFTASLDNVKIASPCPADWNEMIGNERKKYCSECKLNVYNLSDMTKSEAENFLTNSEGRVCIKFFRRADGSVLTKDCPVGQTAFKKRLRKKANAFLALCTGIFGGLVAYVQFQPTRAIQTNHTNLANAVRTDKPTIVIDAEKNESKENRNISYESVTGMLIVRTEPETKKVKMKKSVKSKRK